MQAEIITIGDEILIGQIVDTNSAYISKELNKIGISVYQITSVQDEHTHILTALSEANNRSDLVIVTGGLGPTKDDITKQTFCDFFEDHLVENQEVLKIIHELFRRVVKQPPLPSNLTQALVPSKAEVLPNSFGTAPGLWMQQDKTIFISLPGVPYEMKALMQEEVLPKLQERFQRPYIYHKTILTYGMGESAIAELIKDWETALPTNIKLAYLPNLGRVRLRLSSRGPNKKEVIKGVENQIKTVLPLIESVFVGFEEEGHLEVIIGELLSKRKQTLSIAESCTGGQIAELITAKSGASAFFKGSVTTYATQTKIDVLNVSEALINEHTVVSAQVAEAMASQVQKLFKTEFAISTTGIAGPTKGDALDEVGTVFIAIASPNGLFSEKFNFGNNRKKVIERATNKALELLRKEILKN